MDFILIMPSNFRMAESADAIDDSDDEADYTKMDQGNKKGPVGRWDFDTQEEYSDYMSNKEALPKYVRSQFSFRSGLGSHFLLVICCIVCVGVCDMQHHKIVKFTKLGVH